MFSNPGLTLKHTEVDIFQTTASIKLIIPKLLVFNVHIWLQIFSLTKKLYLLLSPSLFFTFKIPLPQILVFVVHLPTHSSTILVFLHLCSQDFPVNMQEVKSLLLCFHQRVYSRSYSYHLLVMHILSLYTWLSYMLSFVISTPLGIFILAHPSWLLSVK